MLRLIFVRHGQYSGSVVFTKLTEEGQSTSKAIAEKLKSKGIIPDSILTSPVSRAVESATIESKVFQGAHEPVVQEDLHVGYDKGEFSQRLKENNPPAKTIISVTHESVIRGNTRFWGAAYEKIDVPESGAVILEFKQDNWIQAHDPRIEVLTP